MPRQTPCSQAQTPLTLTMILFLSLASNIATLGVLMYVFMFGIMLPEKYARVSGTLIVNIAEALLVAIIFIFMIINCGMLYYIVGIIKTKIHHH